MEVLGRERDQAPQWTLRHGHDRFGVAAVGDLRGDVAAVGEAEDALPAAISASVADVEVGGITRRSMFSAR